MYDKLREWFDTFDSDPFTVAVVGALVDCAETLWQADGMLGEPLGSESKQALRKDAERYRFIRDNHEVRGSAMEIVYGMNGSDWDAAIDAALAKERP